MLQKPLSVSNIPQLEKVNFKVRYWLKKKRKDTGVKPVEVSWAELPVSHAGPLVPHVVLWMAQRGGWLPFFPVTSPLCATPGGAPRSECLHANVDR